MVPTMPNSAWAPMEQSYWYRPGTVKVTLPMQVPFRSPNVLGKPKATGLPKDSPVIVEMSPLTLCREVDSFCHTTVPPVGMETALGVYSKLVATTRTPSTPQALA